MSIGSIKDYTPNFKLIIPRFDLATWHDYIEQNFRSIDAMFYNLFAINDYKGEWKNSTTYSVGDTLFIGEDGGSDYEGRLVKVKVEHTTPASGTYSDELEAHPEYYDLYVDAAAATEAAQDAHEVLIDVQSLKNLCETYKNNAKTWAEGTDEEVQALGGTHSSKSWATGIDLSIDDLGGTDIDNPQDGEFLMYNEGKWVNTESSASVTWGGITGTLSNQLDLQEALDAAVHKTGNETVAGTKIFQGSSDEKIHIQNTNVTYDTAPLSSENNTIAFVDKNDYGYGIIQSWRYIDNSTFTLISSRGANNTWPSTALGIGMKSDGTVYTLCPTPTDTTSTTSQQIVNVGWSNLQFVHLTGNETIGGTKTFTANLTRAHTDLTKGTNPSNPLYWGIEFTDKNGPTTANRLGLLETKLNTNGDVETYISASLNTNGSTAQTALKIVYTKSGYKYAIAPASDIIDSIVTTISKNKASIGSFKLGNGLLVNWGSKTMNKHDNTTCTFDTPFSGNYTFGLSCGYKSSISRDDPLVIKERTSTNFKVYNTANSDGGDITCIWLAIGY